MSLKSYIYATKLWSMFGKNSGELSYWRSNVDAMIRWYQGQEEWRLPFPTNAEKETRFDLRKNAIMTYVRKETESASYLRDLRVPALAFEGSRVADIGSGPFPTLLVFENCERYCLDHLIDEYRKLGYPLEEYENEITFVNCKSEKIPYESGYFDVVISRNALDHVDDFQKTATEMKRVLRPGGVVHILVNCHKPTKTEPQKLDDAAIIRAFGDIGVRKISGQKGAWGFTDGETSLWSNLPEDAMAPPVP